MPHKLIAEILQDHATFASLDCSREFHELASQIESGYSIDLNPRIKHVGDVLRHFHEACIAREAFRKIDLGD